MRWQGRRESSNVEDRRGGSGGGARGMKGAGGGAVVLVIIVMALKFFGAPDELQQVVQQGGGVLLDNAGGGGVSEGQGVDDETGRFIRVVLADTENVWDSLFREQLGEIYPQPTLKMFSDQTDSRCGPASSAMGPFYCPADQMIYIDPSFFVELATRHRAGGDFAQAYVIAHEVAHHVQNVLGDNREANAARQSGDKRLANQMSVRLELQADFLAGVWAHHLGKEKDVIEDGDIEEAIQAAFRIGDDTLQREATGSVRPEHFTHGTSKQRAYWFQQGKRSGRMSDRTQLFSLPYDRL